MKYNTIKIPKGNDCELWLKSRMLDRNGKPGKVVPAEELTDVVVKFTVKGEEFFPEYRIQDGFVCAKINDGLPCGEYDVCIMAKWAGRDIRDNRQELIAIVEYSDGINYGLYKQDFVVIGSTPAEIDELRARMLNKIEEAENAKAAAETERQEYIRKQEELDGVAQEATCQVIKSVADSIAATGAKSTELNPLAKEDTAQFVKEAVIDIKNAVGELNPEGEEKPKLYDMVATLVQELATTKAMLAEVASDVAYIKGKVDANADKAEAIETKVESVSTKLYECTGKVYNIDGKVDTIGTKLTEVDEKADALASEHAVLTTKVDQLIAEHADQDQKLFDINNTVNEIDGHLHPNA